MCAREIVALELSSGAQSVCAKKKEKKKENRAARANREFKGSSFPFLQKSPPYSVLLFLYPRNRIEWPPVIEALSFSLFMDSVNDPLMRFYS